MASTTTQTERNTWKVQADAHSEYRPNDGENVSGLKILLVNEEFGAKKEIARVAFKRENGEKKGEDFETVLKAELKKAATAATTMNKLLYEVKDPIELM